jgi:hypothetical protein
MSPRYYQFEDEDETRRNEEKQALAEQRFAAAVDACKLMALQNGEGSTLHIGVEQERYYAREGTPPTHMVAMCNMISVLRDPNDHEMRYPTCKLCNSKHRKALEERGDSSW